MYERTFRKLLAPVVLLSAIGILATATPTSAAVNHGIVMEKGCESPTTIGSPYECSYTLIQPVPGDTATITSITDHVVTTTVAGGVTSTNLLPLLTLNFTGTASCNAGQTVCTIPFGSSISSDDFSFYTVQAADFSQPNHQLNDHASAAYSEVCTGQGAGNCPVGTLAATAGSSTTVQQFPSQTTTTVQLAGSTVTTVALGSTVTDQATVSGTGAGTPTGTVTFTYFTNGTCTGNGSPAGTGTLSSGQASSSPEGPLSTGSYSFQASYGGDANYAASAGACEPFTVGQGPTVTTTSIQMGGTTVTSVPLGSSVTDQATVSGTGAGTPTGTVTFTFFTNGTCSGTGATAGTGTLAAGVANSSSEGPLTAAGSYSFQANYGGDANYIGSAGICELLTVTKASSQTTTAVRQGGATVTSVALGTSVTDQATVSGTGAGTPTGSVTFTVFPNGTCTSTGTGAGTGTLASGVANSNAVGPLTAGSYSFQASYSGDSNYTSSTGSCEPFTVGHGMTVTTTAVQQGGATVTSVALGTSVTDQATVAGSGAGTPTGTVNFTFFGNGTCAGTGTPAGTGTLAGGVANSSVEGPLAAAGSYSFLAAYSGDANYTTSTGACELFTVTKAASQTVTAVRMSGLTVSSVALGSSVTDQATVSGTGAGTPTGTVTFTFFSNSSCTGTGSPSGTGTLASGVAVSNSQGPLNAGSYGFQATYNGDANYLGSTGSCEPFTVTKASSQTVTAIRLAGTTVTSVALGSTVTDQATVSGAGAGTPTGTVSFTFFTNATCAGAGTAAGTGALTAGVANSSSEGPLSAAGSYSFQATYGGDSNYVSSTGSCEPLTVPKAPSQTTTVVQSGGVTVTSVPLGSTVTDQATVSGTGAGTPTGTVSFTFFANGTCTGTGTAAGTGAVTAGVANSSSEGPLSPAGSYSFQATYSGDSNYLSSPGSCEPLSVPKAPSQTTTSVQSGGQTVVSVPLGSTVTDQATVSGTGAGTPTGTASFTFFTNATCTGTGAGAGSAALTAGVANSSSEGPLNAAGSYSFQASYSGDGNYLSSTGTCEPFTVGQGPTVTTTTVFSGGAPVTSVALGSTVTDQATVSGTGAGTPTGSVSFLFFSNGLCTGTGAPAGTASLVSGSAPSSPQGPLSAAGSYSFQATYSGDSNYIGSIGACEPFSVTKAPSVTTTSVRSGGQTVVSVPLGSTVTDQATVSGAGAGTPTGSVTFLFFTTGNCTGSGAPAGGGALVGGIATSSSEGPLSAGSYSFQAQYGGDSNYLSSPGSCEPFTVGSGMSVTVTTVRQGGSAVTAVALGSTVTDQATVSGSGAGTPTGTVTFTFFSNGACTGTGTTSAPVALVSGVANSAAQGPLATAGSYSFQASYGGDGNYQGSTGACEPFTVTKASSQTVTTVQQAGATVTSVALGSSVTDQATVSGTGAGTPTGSVTFMFFAGATCTGTSAPAGTGALASGVANSSSVGPIALAGSYSFQASYSGDANYLPSTGSCEPFTVPKAPSQAVTVVQSGGAPVTSVSLGSTVSDQVTVTGSGGGTPTGTAAFTFFSNGACTGTGTPAGTGALASGVANSSSEGPLTAGSYSFQASYGGDANYLSTTGACEPFTVLTASTQTATAVQQGGATVTSVALGSSVTDQATVSGSGAGTPTGTVTFTFFANGTCTGTGTAAGTAALASGVANSGAEGPLTAAGSYSFQASYNGDTNYQGSTGSCEPFIMTKAASQTITAVQQGGATVTSVALGTSVTDQATVSGTGAGTPTGTVSFLYFTNGACTGTGAPAGSGTLASGAASSNSEGPLSAGSYSFEASYGGDANYLSSTGTCEPFTVGTGMSVTVTTVRQGGSAVTSVALGTSVTDQATVSGSGAGTPTGTVSFTFFSNATCTGTGTAAGTNPLASGVANSSSEGPLSAAGSYSFQASYNGDTNYQGSTGTCEPFTVTKAGSQTITAVQQGGATVTSVALGSSVTDQATVSGTGAGTPTGTVSFVFYAGATCAGASASAGTGALASGVANSSSVGPVALAGSYSFQASYGGDGNYLPSTGSCEPFTVTKAASQTITAVQQGGATVTSVALGSSVTDQATVSGAGAGTPTGTVSFTFFSNATCTGTGTAAGTGALTAGVANSGSEGPLSAAGSYSFQASYNGDTNYQGSAGTCEPFTVAKAASQTITAVQQGGATVTSVALGSSVTDQATVSGTGAGTPTGTVSFTFFSNATCTGTGTAAGTNPLASGVANSSSEGPLSAAGSYSFQASYNGDTNYQGSTGTCEPFTVTKAGSQTITAVQQRGATVTSVALGSSVSDQATVSGIGAGAPTGTVTFTFFTNSTCTATGTAAGTGSLASGVANSSSVGPLALAGAYSFQASYGGDANYLPSAGACEPFTVSKAPSQTATVVQSAGVTVTSLSLGATATDQATVTGTGAGTPTGTVAFTFFANGTCTGTGSPAGTTALTAGVATSSPQGPLTAGPFSFQAAYSGDGNYLPSTGSCEPFTVSKAPSQVVTAIKSAGQTVTTVPVGTTVTDQVTVTGTGAGTPTGTAAFTFFANGTCTGTGSPAGTPTLVAGVATSSAEGPLTAGSYSFRAASSGDANYLGATGTCEPLSVTAPSLSITKTADATPVSAGTTIGFAITVANSATPGTATATAVTLNDPLPAGTGINWSISPAYGGPGTCSISGAVGSQVLNCAFGNMAPGASASIHISSATSATCPTTLTLKNTATASASNAPSVNATATIVVTKPVPPYLSITKTADAASVSAGTSVGFTVKVSNSAAAGTGTATAVTLNDPLPAGTGINWSISPAYGGPGTCAISGAVGSQVLKCSFGDLVPGASASIHIASATSSICATVITLKNTATASASNAPDVSASATIVVQPVSPPKTTLTETASTYTQGYSTTITFTYKEKNTGTVGITGVKVSGSYCGTATFVSSSDSSTKTLDPGATWTYTCSKTISNKGSGSISVTDNATATGNSAVTGQAAAPETAYVTVKVRCYS
jgi:uncharacterized repeat protein (TIGR01451 family)